MNKKWINSVYYKPARYDWSMLTNRDISDKYTITQKKKKKIQKRKKKQQIRCTLGDIRNTDSE